MRRLERESGLQSRRLTSLGRENEVLVSELRGMTAARDKAADLARILQRENASMRAEYTKALGDFGAKLTGFSEGHAAVAAEGEAVRARVALLEQEALHAGLLLKQATLEKELAEKEAALSSQQVSGRARAQTRGAFAAGCVCLSRGAGEPRRRQQAQRMGQQCLWMAPFAQVPEWRTLRP